MKAWPFGLHRDTPDAVGLPGFFLTWCLPVPRAASPTPVLVSPEALLK